MFRLPDFRRSTDLARLQPVGAVGDVEEDFEDLGSVLRGLQGDRWRRWVQHALGLLLPLNRQASLKSCCEDGHAAFLFINQKSTNITLWDCVSPFFFYSLARIIFSLSWCRELKVSLKRFPRYLVKLSAEVWLQCSDEKHEAQFIELHAGGGRTAHTRGQTLYETSHEPDGEHNNRLAL